MARRTKRQLNAAHTTHWATLPEDILAPKLSEAGRSTRRYTCLYQTMHLSSGFIGSPALQP